MIHQYKLNGYAIVLDIPSGSVHVVDDVAYDAIALYETHSKEEIAQRLLETYGTRPDVTKEEISLCLSDIEQLKAQGTLFSSSSYLDSPMEWHPPKPVIKALCLHVAHTCNLNCTYCFAGQGEYQGRQALMDFETGKRALDFLIEHSGTRTNLEVDFFGGEPLLNWDVVKQLVAYGRSQETIHHKTFRFTLTTNGVLLDDDVMDFSNREMHNVVLSLDGRKEIHDRLRKDAGGNGSYDRIVPKFQEFIRRRGQQGYYIRGTFTHNNVDFTNDVFHMADLGFTQLSMEPVVCAPGEPYALTEEDLPELYAQYELLAKEMLKREREGRGFTFYHYMVDLQSGPCIYKRITGCGSGTEYLAVTPWGELFPCHQFVGDPDYSMGTVWDGVTNAPLQQAFRQCNIHSKPECADCWARLYCSGGCAANAYHATGRITGSYEYGCQLFRKRMECAIMLQAALQLGETEQGDGQ